MIGRYGLSRLLLLFAISISPANGQVGSLGTQATQSPQAVGTLLSAGVITKMAMDFSGDELEVMD
jgi:hypothetical protein